MSPRLERIDRVLTVAIAVMNLAWNGFAIIGLLLVMGALV